MLGRAFGRVASAADLLRPRVFFRTLSRVDPLVDVTRELRSAVEALRVQTEQLMTIQRLDSERQWDLPRLRAQLDPARIDAHVTAAVDAAVLESDPCPHVVVEDWLPAGVYDLLVDAIPPAVFFVNGDPVKQQLAVPFSVAPLYSREAWTFVVREIVSRSLQCALNRKFAVSIRSYVRSFCHDLPSTVDLTLHASDGRIMLRRPGYNLAPHRDPKWGFVTCLIYLARPGDSEQYGTQLYRVIGDEEAPNGKVFYVGSKELELVRSVPFRANSMLVFLNSTGAHGASIPSDALPPALERYLYQVRLGPTPAVVRRLLQAMPPDVAARWAGAKVERATASPE